MELRDNIVPGHKTYDGKEFLEVVAGKRLSIETSPAGIELLGIVCPAGKKWEVLIVVNIKELDA